MPDAPEIRPPAKPPALGALLARPGRWFGFGAAVAASLYLARMLSILVREVIGHGLLAAGLGGKYDSYTISPWLEANAHWYGVHEDLTGVVRWGGTVAEGVLGLVALWIFLRKPRPLRTRSLALAALVATSLGGATAYAIWGALVGTGDTADLHELPTPARVAVVVGLVAVLFGVLRWYVGHLLRWTEEQFVPKDRRQRVACFLLAVVLPIALLAGAIAYGGFPRFVYRDEVLLATLLPLVLFAAYGAWRAARFLFPIGIHRLHRVVFAKGVVWLVVAGAVFAAAAAGSAGSIEVGLGSDRPRGVPRTRDTGGERKVELHESSFPRTALTPGLLEPPVRQPRDASPRFTRGPDGKPGLWVPDDGVIRRVDETGATVERVPLDARFGNPLAPVWALGEGRAPLVLAASEKGPRVEVQGIQDNASLWTWSCPDCGRSIKASTLLYDERGPVGVALGLGGERGVVGVDLEGSVLWQIPKEFVLYEMRAHPALPGRLLTVGGDVMLVDGAAKRGTPKVVLGHSFSIGGKRLELDPNVFAGHAALFPDEKGDPAVVLSNDYSPPGLLRIDATGREVWRAALPSETEGLAMVEPPGGPRLFVVTTEGGDLLVVGDDGTLYASERLPGASTATYHLAAGEIREGVWGVYVNLLKADWLYRLHPELIGAK